MKKSFLKNWKTKASKRISLILAALMLLELLMPGSLLTQSALAASDAPDTVFEKTYGGTGTDVGYAVVEADGDDGGFVLAGSAYESGLTKALLIKTDKDGVLVWSYKYQYLDAFGYTELRSITKTSDGGYMAVGSTRGSVGLKTKIYTIKVDKDGAKVWEKGFYPEIPGLGWEACSAFSVQETTDLGFVISGQMQYGQQSDAYLLKLDSAGNKVWEKNFGDVGVWDWGYSVQQTEDGGFILAGSTSDMKRQLLIKTDANGETTWQKVLAGDSMEALHAKCVYQTKDKGYILSGVYGGKNVYLMKVDAAGVKKWTRIYGEGIGYSVIQLKNADFMVVGGQYSSNGIYIVRADSNGNMIWEKDVGTAGDSAYSVKQTKDDGCIIAGMMGGDAALIKLPPESKVELKASSPYYHYKGSQTGSVLLYAAAFKPDDTLDTSGTLEVKVKYEDASDSSKEVELIMKDDGTGGDFNEKDGVYTAWFEADRDVSVNLDLYVEGSKRDSLEVEAKNYPDLVVLTDFKALYAEFIDTGTLKTDDKDRNNIPDIYDLIDRIYRYADKHEGIVFDLRKEITTAKDATREYKDLDYVNDPLTLGLEIDSFIERKKSLGFTYLAIIGDDEVVPFFRKASPMMFQEKEYVTKDLGGFNYGNPTLRSSELDYVMSDVPYATYDDSLPADPKLDAGFGRIFADRPNILIEMIDGYETDLNFGRTNTSVAIFAGHDEGDGHINWPLEVEETILPSMPAEIAPSDADPMSGPYTGGKYYWYNGEEQDWSASDITAAIENSSITMYWFHANHFEKTTRNNASLQYSDYSAMSDSPGHMLISMGCHSGYSVSHNNEIDKTEDFASYEQAMVNHLLQKKVSYIASTGYGWLLLKGVGYSDIYLQQFFKNIMMGNTTVGNALRYANRGYWLRINPADSMDVNSYVGYATTYYGLPTQRVIRDPAAVTASVARETGVSEKYITLGLLKASLFSEPTDPIRTMDFNVQIPEFKVTIDQKGEALYEIPGSSAFRVNAFAPMIPMVCKTYLLPKNTVVNNVALASSTSTSADDVVLAKVIPVNGTSGPLTEKDPGITGTYPSEVFWWKTEKTNEGVLLQINITPMQYDMGAKEATLYHSLDFTVSYVSPNTGTSIDAITINGNDPVTTDLSSLPVSVQAQCDIDQSLTMRYMVTDQGGNLLDSGSSEVALVSGANTLAFSIKAEGMQPGAKDLTVCLLKDGVIMASGMVSFRTVGLSLHAEIEKNTYYVPTSEAKLTAEVRNEMGQSLVDLTDADFNIAIDGTRVAHAVSYDAALQQYQITFLLSGVTEGHHSVQVTCTDIDGHSGTDRVSFDSLLDVTVPYVKRSMPLPYDQGVGTKLNITVLFNENITEGPKYSEILLMVGDEAKAYTAQLNNNTMVITPTEEMPFGTRCTVTLPTGAIMDAAGNENTAYSFYFTTVSAPDVSPPSITRASPSDGLEGVVIDSLIYLTYSETVREGASFDQIKLMADGEIVPYTVSLVWKNLTITPKHPLPFSANCELILPEGALWDLSGNGTAQETIQFKTEYSFDNIRPTIEGTYPVDGMIDVTLEPVINILYSEIIKGGGSYADIKLTKEDGETVPLTKSINGNLLTLRPDAVLASNSYYTVTLPVDSCRDLNDNGLEATYAFSFMTGNPPDVTSPVKVRTSPKDGETGVSVNASVTVTYDELLFEGPNIGKITLIEEGAAEGKQLNASVTGSLLTITLDPADVLAFDTKYIVTIPAGSVMDAEGNKPKSEIQFNFTTDSGPDVTAPDMSGSVPIIGDTGVSVDTEILIRFTENIFKSADVDITLSSGGSTVTVAPVITGSEMKIFPTGSWANSADYILSIPAGAVVDQAGNGFAGCTIPFTTESEPDTIPPAVVNEKSNPAAGSEGVLAGSYIKLTFTENIRNEVDMGKIHLTSGEEEILCDAVAVGKVLNLKPIAPLAYEAEIRLLLEEGAVSDLSGNPLNESYTLVFTTEMSKDSTPPMMLSCSFGTGDYAVQRSTLLYVTFDEGITIGSGEIIVKGGLDGTGNPISTDNFVIKAIGQTLEIDPKSSLQANDEFTLILSKNLVTDLAGNELEGEITIPFATMPEKDTTPPSVSGKVLQYKEGELVSISTSVILEFSERIRWNTDSKSEIKLEDETSSPVSIRVDISNSGADQNKGYLTIIPLSALQYNKTYKLIVPAGLVEDFVANAVATDDTFTFITEPRPQVVAPPAAPLPPSNRTFNASDIWKDADGYYSADLTEKDAEEGVIISTDGLKQILKLPEDFRLNLPGGAVIRITGRLAEQALGENSGAKLLVRLASAPEETAPPTGHRPIGEILALQAIVYYGDTEERVHEGALLELPFEEGPERWRIQVYAYDGEAWVFAGGKIGAAGKRLVLPLGPYSSYRIMEQTAGFTDTAGHWAEADILALSARQIAKGYLDGSYAPDRVLTRAEMAVFLHRTIQYIYLKPTSLAKPDYVFSDVTLGEDWYADSVASVCELGLMVGFSDGTFRPDDLLTREQTAAIMIRILEALETDLPTEDTIYTALTRFSDSKEVSIWAKPAASTAVSIDLFRGSEGRLQPKGPITRAEIAALVRRTLDYAQAL